MSNSNWTLQLSPELSRRAQVLKRDNQTPNEVMEQIFKLGLFQLEYRRENNPKKNLEMKELRALKKKIQQDPEAAVKFGYGYRPQL